MKVKFYDKNGDFIVQLNSEKRGDNFFETCRIDKDILKKSAGELSIRCEVPIQDMHGFWSPDRFRPKMQLDWRIEFSCAAQRNFPYLCFFNQAQINRVTIGTGNLFDDSFVSATMNQHTGSYDLEIIVSICEATDEFDFFVDLRGRYWPEIMHDYRAWVRPDWQPAYPEAAWQPVYCTWYAVHAAVERQWLEEHIDIAAALGFGTFIVDDGWCFDDMKRVTPQTIGNWYENIGDWQVSGKQLPDFKMHVARAQALGLKYLLWVSPFMIGAKSRFYSETDCTYLCDEHEGYRIFDPADETAAAKSLKYLLDAVNNYGLDGLKIDFVDAVPQSLKAPHGRTVYKYMKKLLDKIKADNPEALFEFRQRYTTPLMLDMATQFRAGDVPFDFIENLHRIAQIRICLGDKVPVHADPVYWNPDESVINVARHMICSLAGVPMVSMDLNKLSAEHRNVIEYWLNFYKKHLDIFRDGHWRIKYEFDHLAYITVENKDEKIIFLCDNYRMHEAIDKFRGGIYLLNLSSEIINPDACTAFDCGGATVAGKYIPEAGLGIINGGKNEYA